MLNKTKRIFVSNRLPFNIDAKTGAVNRGSGGLVSALMGVSLNEPFAWMGFETNAKHAAILQKKSSEISANLSCHPVLLGKEIYDRYYDGFSNDILWPLFHYEGHLAIFSRENWEAYVAANKLMAEAIAKIALPGDTVWIHDFHFMMLPQFLRELCPTVKIGFFLHIPFPSGEVFRQLPVRLEIMKAMTHCDLVGFHEHSYLRQFIVSLKSILGIDSTFFKAEFGSHTLHLGVYPISIDSAAFMQKAKSPEVIAQTQAYLDMSTVPYLVLGVDRLDYTKGLELKLRGFQCALKKYPELVGKVTFMQIAVPTRQKVPYYAKIKKEIDQLVGSINGEFAEPHYTPVHYIFNSVSEVKLIALYRRANAALVTSKRDGMNLVAMEYAMAQDLETSGVLILSEFAGAASFLGDALIVNPWDVDAIADALYRAFHMTLQERKDRMANMQEVLSRYSATKWAEGFLKDLDDTVFDLQIPVKPLSQKASGWPAVLKKNISESTKIRLVLDYDGTLVSLHRKPEYAVLPKTTGDFLESLNKKVEIYIVSGRSRAFLDKHVGHLKVHIAAEHGAFWRAPGGEWQNRVASDIQSWYGQVEKVMHSYSDRVPLSAIERKEASIVWHYRESPIDFADFQAKRLDDELQVGLSNSPVVISQGSRIVEAKAIECNKGNYLRSLIQDEEMESASAYFYICMGDDRTDEDMFRSLGDHGVSIKVGPEDTGANFRLQSQTEVFGFFSELNEFLGERRLRVSLTSVPGPV
ncbi:MAG: bifunctional alpha,alpha-trehalose-phosphate synthase (UDP-forming)/trehalose-phosphatase [Bdellovibrionaceae bacterium]|nr:bifunctional alpha,alpha-trehalose-phosphate synthase (UDP-forming)/trehalose-phosphatase [Pseudobdellovibrionaceae bacterium]